MRSTTILLAASLAAAAAFGRDPEIAAEVPPGHLVRWPGPELVSCSIGARSWQPVDGACWYPIDLEATGTVELVRRSSGGVATRRVRVGAYLYPTQRLEVEEKYVSPPADQLERIARERASVERLFALESPGMPRLPLGAPLATLPNPGRFGSRRVFNGEPRSPHSGADFSSKPGTAVLAVADGRVALAEEQYFAGNAVFLDHGDGLVSMSFHLATIDVQEGATVRRGERIGTVGATGRVTGPHLHFGLRWHGARVDPELLLDRVDAVEIR